MTVFPIGLHAMRTPPEVDQPGAVERFAASFALRGQQESEELIESFCIEAIRQWHLNDATFWQRVKFRARMLRAMAPESANGHLADRPSARSSERNV